MATKKPSSKEQGVYKITLNPTVKNAAFEKFMETAVLEKTITFRDGHSSQDELYLQRSQGKAGNAYLWIISRTPSLSGTFALNSDALTAFKSLKSKVEEFGVITSL